MRILYYLKWPLAIFLIGSIIRIAGELMKVLHWRGADKTLVLSTVLLIVGLILVIAKLVILKKNGQLPADKS